jgi:putative redox protein
LAALLDEPVGRPARAYALFAHCFTCSKDLKAIHRISRALSDEGIAVLRFDFTGLGQSEGEFAETTFSSNVDDLVAAAELMQRELEAPSVLIGHSLGGAAVIQARSRIPSVRAVATIAAPFDPSVTKRHFEDATEQLEQEGEAEIEIMGRTFRLRREFVEDLHAHRMDDALAALDAALLIFHSPVDRIVGVHHATKIFQAAKHPKSFVSLDRADHLLSHEADARYVGAVIAAWALKYLDEPEPLPEEQDPADNRVVARIGRVPYRTDVLANGHHLVGDEPERVGGGDTGPSPYELLASALGTCTVMTLRMYADRKEWPLEAAEVRIRHEKVHCTDCERPNQKLDQLSREVVLVGDLDDDQRQRLLEIADRCPVHRTLTEGRIEVTTKLADA